MAGANPYVGPRSFVAGETLYGRDREAAELQDLLIAERIVLLYSPSGAGKTSLLQAKLLPAMAGAGFQVRPIVRPGNEPAAPSNNRFIRAALDSLGGSSGSAGIAEFLGKPASPELLVFDQFEEVLNIDPGNRDAKTAFFIEIAQALRHRGRWALFSMREDYIAGLDPYAKLVPTRFASTYRLDLLDRDRAVEAIREPARAAGVDFTLSAAEKLADNLRRAGPYVEPVQLQVVCLRLWGKPRPEAGQIAEGDVGDEGDIDQALAYYYADCVAKTVSPAAPERAIRAWFDRRLISKQGTRTQVLRGPEQDLDNAAIAALVDCHLVRSDQRHDATWYELAHDRLIPPVQEDNRKWRENNLSPLQRQAELWDDQKRPDGALLRGAALAAAAHWAKKNPGLNPVERDFLEACIAERKRQRWRDVAIGAVAVLAIAAIALFVWGLGKNREAQANLKRANKNADDATKATKRALTAESEANDQARLANAGRLAATAVLNKQTHPTLALLLAVESFHIAPIFESRDAVLLALQANSGPGVPPLGHAIAGAPGQVTDIAFSPDGKLIAMSSTASKVQLWDAAHLTLKWELDGPGEMRADSVAFSPDGKTLATGGIDGRIWLWNTETGTAKGEPLQGHSARVPSLVFSPDGTMLASGSQDQSARLWELAGRRQLDGPLRSALAVGNAGPTVYVAFRRDSKVLASGDAHGLSLWDAILRKPWGVPLDSKLPNVWALAFSPKENVIAVADDSTIRLWDLDAGNLIGTPLDGHKGNVTGLSFSRDGETLASSGFDDSARLWDVATERPLGDALSLGTPAVWAVAFSPDGKTLVTGNVSGAQVWDVDPISWAKRSCALAKRNLSDGEWKQYVGKNMPYHKTCPDFPLGDGVKLPSGK